jgi:hypothetical protein
MKKRRLPICEGEERGITKEEAIERFMIELHCSREEACVWVKKMEEEYPDKQFSEGH